VLEIYTDGDALPVIIALQNGDPSIHADAGRAREGIVVIRPSCLKPEDLEPLAGRLNELLTA
jgi:hypothetical protein